MAADDPPGGNQFCIAAPVSFELRAVEPVRCPSVALDEQTRPSESEVHLPPFDDRMKLHDWEREALHEVSECQLEHAVGGLGVDRPVVHCATQGRDAGTAGASVLQQR